MLQYITNTNVIHYAVHYTNTSTDYILMLQYITNTNVIHYAVHYTIPAQTIY